MNGSPVYSAPDAVLVHCLMYGCTICKAPCVPRELRRWTSLAETDWQGKLKPESLIHKCPACQALEN